MSNPGLHLGAVLRRFLGDRRGVASIMGAMIMLTGLGVSVMVLDVGHLYLAKRRLQSAVDAAALAAAGDPTNANTIVAHVLTDRGYSQTATIATGAYSANSSLPMASRLDTGPAAQKNAVRVTLTISTPSVLARIVDGTAQSNVAATATASQIPVVSFSAGTGLATLSGGQINTVLGGLLGTTLSLSLANYQALASVNVDALTFLNQLAAQAGVSAGTYGDLAATSVTMSQLATAITAALNIHPDGNDAAAIDALNLLALQTPASVTAPVGQIVSTALWQNRQVGSVAEQTPGQVAFNTYDLMSGMGRAYGSGHLVNLGTTLSVPVGGVTLSTNMALGSPMASLAAARVGDSISTAQTRLAIKANIVNANLGLPAQVTFSFPLYLQLAGGSATVAAIPCQTGGTMARISASAQAASAQIGGVTNSALVNFGANPTLQPAIISVSVLGIPVSITVSGAFPVAAGAPTDENFTQSDIDTGAVKEAAGNNPGAVFSGLAGNLQISFTLLSNPGLLGTLINNTLNNTLKPLLLPILTGILTGLDGPTDLLLRTLGLRLGVMDVTVHGVRCGTPTLVT